MSSSIFRQITELYGTRAVLWQLVRQHLILRYRRTALGYLWTLINPLLMMTVTAFVFSTLFKADLKTYAVYLFAGMIPWNCFSGIVTQSGAAFISNEGLIKKIYLPKMIFPLSIALGVLIDSVLSFFALFLIIFAIGGHLTWALLFVPLAYLILFIFSLGIALFVSILTVFFRDLQHIILIAMQAWFFLTPIMYKNEALIGKVAWLVSFNPVVPFVDMFRAPLTQGVFPSSSSVITSLMLAIGTFFLGYIFFLLKEKKIIFRL
ncbi:ABC-2 type transport system permease protein/lipopolysaccharide transport system permease protein [Pseudomonas brassicacearum]|uniref:Transport permease protein n=1 Tax=Pseudomonas brassicacearum TaxID=930166 RepID=A0AAW8M3A8_9PSED|nr:ABC transporter permease [Pseudomonas brassicacearum]MDR6956347.1 ABC-2 type transport system permease protein/lipopolysaccharide transport system permease protein [Pseudomonas brassicacearum]